MLRRAPLAVCISFIAAALTSAQSAVEINLPRVQRASSFLKQPIEDAMNRAKTPGVAVAVVYKDQVVYLEGFGLRKVGQAEPVTPDTVFQLASVSKPMTGTVMGAMVTQGLLSWEDRIAALDPAFALSDSWVTSHLTILDLMTHRTGLPDHAGDILEDLGYPRREVLRRLRFVSPLGRFRDEYAYTNFGVTQAAEAAARKHGGEWEDIASKFIYRPLGMSATSSRHADYAKAANRAFLHVPDNGQMVAKYDRNPDAQSPAGGVSSSVRDLAKWLRMLLNKGTFEGKQIIDAKVLAKIHSPLMLRGVDPASGRGQFYGIGWNVNYDDRGSLRVSHSGAFSMGAGTTAALVPGDGVGIVVLTNAFPNGVAEAMVDTFFDLLYNDSSGQGKLSQDWVGLWTGRFKQFMVDEFTNYSKLPRPASIAAGLPLTAYAGTYRSEYYGDLRIAQKDDRLMMFLGPKQTSYPLDHWEKNVFTFFYVTENNDAPRGVIFSEIQNGRPRKVLLDSFRADGDGTFTRIDSAATASKRAVRAGVGPRDSAEPASEGKRR